MTQQSHSRSQFSQSCRLFVSPWTAACQASLSITDSWSLLKLMSIESVMPFNYLILCQPLLSHAIFPSIRVFSIELALNIRWSKDWSFSFNISPSSEHPGLVSFRMDWLDLESKTLSRVFSNTTVQKHQFFGTQPSLLVQLSHPYMTTGKTIEFQKNIYFFIDYAKAFDYVDHNKLWKILKEVGVPDHLTCLLRNLYAGQETTVITGHGKTDWLQIRKGVLQGCILSPCLFNLYAEYIMRNSGLEEIQAGIKFARRNINNLRYADDTTLMAENEELKSLLMKVKEESKKLA